MEKEVFSTIHIISFHFFFSLFLNKKIYKQEKTKLEDHLQKESPSTQLPQQSNYKPLLSYFISSDEKKSLIQTLLIADNAGDCAAIPVG